jgi:hypothetical protein
MSKRAIQMLQLLGIAHLWTFRWEIRFATTKEHLEPQGRRI